MWIFSCYCRMNKSRHMERKSAIKTCTSRRGRLSHGAVTGSSCSFIFAHEEGPTTHRTHVADNSEILLLLTTPSRLHRMLAYNRRRRRESNTILPIHIYIRRHRRLSSHLLLLLLSTIQRVVKRTIRRRHSELAPAALFASKERRATARPAPLLLVHGVQGLAHDVVFVPVDARHANDVLRTGDPRERGGCGIVGGLRSRRGG